MKITISVNDQLFNTIEEREETNLKVSSVMRFLKSYMKKLILLDMEISIPKQLQRMFS